MNISSWTLIFICSSIYLDLSIYCDSFELLSHSNFIVSAFAFDAITQNRLVYNQIDWPVSSYTGPIFGHKLITSNQRIAIALTLDRINSKTVTPYDLRPTYSELSDQNQSVKVGLRSFGRLFVSYRGPKLTLRIR